MISVKINLILVLYCLVKVLNLKDLVISIYFIVAHGSYKKIESILNQISFNLKYCTAK
jgi:hypothetical protein